MFTKKTKRTVALLAGLMLPASLIPVTGAFAAATYTVTKQGIAAPGSIFDSRIMVEVPQGSMTGEDKFRVRFPKDTTMDTPTVTVPATYDNAVNNQFADDPTVTEVKAGEEYEITVPQRDPGEGKGILYINLTNVKVPSGSSGDFKAVIDAQAGSVFSSSTTTIATIGTGTVNISIDDVKSMSAGGRVISDIRIKEDRPGALKKYTDSLKLKLPQGFKWDTASVDALGEIAPVWGDVGISANKALEDDDRTLVLNVGSVSTVASYVILKDLQINPDESLAKVGDVTVSISGKSSSSPNDIVVAKYGDYSSAVAAFGDTPTVLAGRLDQEIGKLEIRESMGNSLVEGRTVTLTLPENTRWNTFFTEDTANSDRKNLDVEWKGTIDSEKRILKGVVHNVDGGDAGRLVLEKAEAQIAPNFNGDLNVEVGGSAGLSGKVVLAKVQAPVTMATENVPEVKIGVDGQAAADVTITESVKEALMSKASGSSSTKLVPDVDADGNATGTYSMVTGSENKKLYIVLPAGVQFSAIPKFEVTDGDLAIEEESATTGIFDAGADNGLYYAVVKTKSTSSKPSKIKVSNIKLRVDRSVPEGDLILKIKGNGSATSEVAGFASSTVAKTAIAKVVTPAPDLKKSSEASFTLDSKEYTVNGVKKSMDVAPYAKDGRTFMPIRYVADALGISDANIIWDGDKQSVTLLKGEKVVQLTVGSNSLLINGTAITMDTAPEIADPGRVMLPLRFVAQAFGSEVSWDDATKTASIK